MNASYKKINLNIFTHFAPRGEHIPPRL